LATVRRDVFLQAGNGHGHLVRQAPFLFPCQLAPTDQTSHAVTGFLELTFEPSMLWTTNRMGRKRAHPAPVENVEGEVSRKANKRQTLFSPIIRHWLVIALSVAECPIFRRFCRAINGGFFNFSMAAGLALSPLAGCSRSRWDCNDPRIGNHF
jgi:hypothetical protein